MKRPWSWVIGQCGIAAAPDASLHGNQASRAIARVYVGVMMLPGGGNIILYIETHTYIHAHRHSGMNNGIWIRIDLGINSVLNFII